MPGERACGRETPATSEKSDARRSVDLRPLFNRWKLDARSQGGRGTCSVFAMTAVIEYAVASKQQRATRLSVEFLNWASNDAVGEAIDGGCFSELWAGYAAHGICPESDMPYAAGFDPAGKPDKKAVAHAKKIRGARPATPLDQAVGSQSRCQQGAARRDQAGARAVLAGLRRFPLAER